MLGAGVLHFTSPRFYDRLIPEVLPGSERAWVYGSGVAELVAGGLLTNRRTARMGAWVTFAVLLGVYPGNIYDAVRHPPTDGRGVVSLVRLPLQLPLLWWALRHTRANPGVGTALPTTTSPRGSCPSLR